MLPIILAASSALCAPTTDLHEGLRLRYGEEVVALGDQSQGQRVALYLNRETGTFSVVLMRDGESCMIVSGDGWAEVRGERS